MEDRVQLIIWVPVQFSSVRFAKTSFTQAIAYMWLGLRSRIPNLRLLELAKRGACGPIREPKVPSVNQSSPGSESREVPAGETARTTMQS